MVTGPEYWRPRHPMIVIGCSYSISSIQGDAGTKLMEDITEATGVVTRGGPGWPSVGLQSGEITPGQSRIGLYRQGWLRNE